METQQKEEKKPKPQKSKNLFLQRLIYGFVGIVLFLLFLIWFADGCQKKDDQNEPSKGQPTQPASQTGSEYSGQKTIQLPDVYAPGAIEVQDISDLYTDGDSVYILPPNWPLKDKILHKGKGRLNIENNGRHKRDVEWGFWQFWNAADSLKPTLIRRWVYVDN